MGVRRAVEGDAQSVERARREVQRLPRRDVRRVREGETHGVLAVEGERHGRDPAGPVASLGLDERDVVGADRVAELRLPPLARRVGQEGARDPGGVEVPVDGAVGLVLGGVRDRVAVAARGDVDRADVGGHGLAVHARVREELDRAVAEVRLGRVVARRLGVAGVGDEGVPAERLLAVGVGYHQVRSPGRELP